MQQLRYIKRELNLERDDKQSIIAAFKDAVAVADKLYELPTAFVVCQECIKNLGDKVPEEAAKVMDQDAESSMPCQLAAFPDTVGRCVCVCVCRS